MQCDLTTDTRADVPLRPALGLAQRHRETAVAFGRGLAFGHAPLAFSWLRWVAGRIRGVVGCFFRARTSRYLGELELRRLT
jgi:hypothetical protein